MLFLNMSFLNFDVFFVFLGTFTQMIKQITSRNSDLKQHELKKLQCFAIGIQISQWSEKNNCLEIKVAKQMTIKKNNYLFL